MATFLYNTTMVLTPTRETSSKLHLVKNLYSVEETENINDIFHRSYPGDEIKISIFIDAETIGKAETIGDSYISNFLRNIKARASESLRRDIIESENSYKNLTKNANLLENNVGRYECTLLGTSLKSH